MKKFLLSLCVVVFAVGIGFAGEPGTYSDCLKVVKSGGTAVLVLGSAAAPGTGSYYVRPSYPGIDDGVYDCYLINGVPSMQRRVLYPPAQQGCPNGRCPLVR